MCVYVYRGPGVPYRLRGYTPCFPPLWKTDKLKWKWAGTLKQVLLGKLWASCLSCSTISRPGSGKGLLDQWHLSEVLTHGHALDPRGRVPTGVTSKTSSWALNSLGNSELTKRWNMFVFPAKLLRGFSFSHLDWGYQRRGVKHVTLLKLIWQGTKFSWQLFARLCVCVWWL